MSNFYLNIVNVLKFKCLNLVIIVFVTSFFIKNTTSAQDIHFSQFYSTPILTNPANTGISDDDLRVANNYRNQWARINVPFNTLYISLDKKLSLFNQSFGIGGFIVHDQSSAFNLTADKFLFSLSYSKILNNQQFVLGLQPGFVYKYYNGGITYGSQFDVNTQQFNPNLPSLENLNQNMYYFDMNAGILWRTYFRNLTPSVGFAISHIFRPVESFSSAGEGSRLAMKYTCNGQIGIPINSRFDVTPCFLYGSTTGANELLTGGIIGYNLTSLAIPVKRVYGITMCRINPFQDIDAIIIGGGVKFMKFDLGLTYDINVSPLSSAGNFNGAFEISLIFTGGKRRVNVIEPCIIY